jgi:hypothetical protein
MRDATSQLSQHSQSLLLRYHLLGLTQIVIGALQALIELRLVDSEANVLAQLP